MAVVTHISLNGNCREAVEFYSQVCYGNLTDKFGVNWQFNLENGEI